MDRRQRKTRDSIFEAFSNLLEKKRYSNVTVQEIIEEADTGRSTFYSHFNTKDDLLKSMCTDIFSHVFLDDLTAEVTHDFSSRNNGLEARLSHILHHLKDNKNNMIGILSSESGELLMKYFKEYLQIMFSDYLDEIETNAPVDFVLNHLVGSFAETVMWWIRNRMKYTPEDTAKYFIEINRFDISDRSTS